MKLQKNEIIDVVLNRVADNYPIKRNVVLTANGKRFLLDAILDEGNHKKIYSAWYVGGEQPHILPLFNEHAALGVLTDRGFDVEIECILIVDSEKEDKDWKQWYESFNNLSTFSNIQFTFVVF